MAKGKRERSVAVGIIGLGTVGTGVARLLRENSETISARLGAPLVLKRVADQEKTRDRGVDLRAIPFTKDASDVLRDPDVDIVAELIGGLEPARTFILKALEAGKHVVTANKFLLAHHGSELFARAKQLGRDVGFEASVGGGIPILRGLREGLSANRIQAVYGIINGTANFILSRMTEDGGRFEDALRKAQKLGYAEADPTFDVDGIDTAHKLAILIALSFGRFISIEKIHTEGIRSITPLDIEFARDFGYRVKLLAIAKADGDGLEARVHPTMIPARHLLSTVGGAFNAIYVIGDAVGPVMLYGQGAGMMPTASAVVSDLIEIARNVLHGSPRRIPPLAAEEGSLPEVPLKPIADLVSQYYLRFGVLDRPGVLSKLSGVLGDHDISISSVIQPERKVGQAVAVVILTHEALERNVRHAVEVIDRLPFVKQKTSFVRIESRL